MKDSQKSDKELDRGSSTNSSLSKRENYSITNQRESYNRYFVICNLPKYSYLGGLAKVRMVCNRF